MKAKHVMIVLFMFILFQGFLFTGTPSTAGTKGQAAGGIAVQAPVQIAGAGGENPLVTNVLEGGGFEQVQSMGYPSEWSSSGSCDLSQNASYTGLTYGGSYSGQIVARGTPQWGGDSGMFYRTYQLSSRPYLTQGISIDLYTYIVSNPDLARNGQYYIRAQVWTPSGYRNVVYYMSFRVGYSLGNSSQTVNFALNTTIGYWSHLQRNMTADFESRFGAVQSGSYIYEIDWLTYSPYGSTGPTEVVVDEVNLYNRTAHELLLNGDFEDGDGSHWDANYSSPGYVYTTSDCTEGSRPANLTVRAAQANAWGYAYMAHWYSYPQGLYTAEPGSGVVSFDWNYRDTNNGGSGQGAFLEIDVGNQTYSCTVLVFLGQDLDYFPSENYTSTVYVRASGFGSRGTWEHQSTDLGALLRQRNITDVTIEDFMFYIQTSSRANSSATLLLDSFEFRTYPTIDPGFEQDWYWSTSSPVTGWWTSGAGYPYVNRTSFAHTGNWAANVTAYGGAAGGLYRTQYVEVDASIFTDFWYQLMDTTSASGSIAYIMLYFCSGQTICYLLAASSDYSPTNSSDTVFYYVDGFNQTGTWRNLVRNVKTDLETAFAPTAWILDQVSIYCYGSGGDRLSVIFDDMNFVSDTHAPNFTFVGIDGHEPTYYNEATVRINLTELSPVTTAVYYNNGSGWVRTLAANMGSYFLAYIPKGPYGTVVHWYANATDSLGHSAIDNNHGSCYSYIMGDDIPPVIDSIRPKNSTVVTGLNIVKVNTSDPGVGSRRHLAR